MKKRDLYVIMLNILGLIALWRSVQFFSGVISAVGIFMSFMGENHLVSNPFMKIVAIVMVLSFLVPLVFSYFCIFRKEWFLSILKVDNDETIHVKVNKRILYHILILAFGLLSILNGCSGFISFDFKTETKEEVSNSNTHDNNLNTSSTSQENKEITIFTDSKTINYFSLAEIIFGIVLIVKATEISNRIITTRKNKLKAFAES